MGEVRKAQKLKEGAPPGCIHFLALESEVLAPQIFLSTDIVAGIKSGSKLSSKQYGFVKKETMSGGPHCSELGIVM